MSVCLLVITGLPGSGKSTLARHLAARYHAALLAKDSVKEPLLDTLGAADRGASRRLSEASFAVLFALAREQLAAGCSVLLEGNFRHAEHAAAFAALLSTCAPQHTPRCAQVLCVTSAALRRERLAARAHDPLRHPGHRDAEWLADAAADCADWLVLPGARFVHEGLEGTHWTAVLAALDRWWAES